MKVGEGARRLRVDCAQMRAGLWGMRTDIGEELGLRAVYAQYTRSKKKRLKLPPTPVKVRVGARRLRAIARSNY